MKKTLIAKLFSRTVLVGLFFGLSIPIAFAAALCVTNPEQGLCPVSVTVTPGSYTVPYGGSTSVTFGVSGVLQYEVQILQFDTWMVEDVTGTQTVLDHGAWLTYSGTRTANTGPLTRSVTVNACVENSQGVISCDSSYISLPSCYVENILTLGAGPSVTGSKLLFVGDPAYSVRNYLPKYNYTCTGDAGGNCVQGSIDALGNTSITCSETPQVPPTPYTLCGLVVWSGSCDAPYPVGEVFPTLAQCQSALSSTLGVQPNNCVPSLTCQTGVCSRRPTVNIYFQ